MAHNWTEEELADRYRRLKITPEMQAVMDANLEAFNAALDGKTDSIEWPEHMIEAECTKLLEEDGWRALRTDPVSDRGRGKGFGELGMADHLYFRWPEDIPRFDPARDRWLWAAPCQVMWIEFKKLGEKAKDHQHKWHTIERARGALTLIAGVDFPASVAGFVEHYRASGLNRGRV